MSHRFRWSSRALSPPMATAILPSNVKWNAVKVRLPSTRASALNRSYTRPLSSPLPAPHTRADGAREWMPTPWSSYSDDRSQSACLRCPCEGLHPGGREDLFHPDGRCEHELGRAIGP